MRLLLLTTLAVIAINHANASTLVTIAPDKYTYKVGKQLTVKTDKESEKTINKCKQAIDTKACIKGEAL